MLGPALAPRDFQNCKLCASRHQLLVSGPNLKDGQLWNTCGWGERVSLWVHKQKWAWLITVCLYRLPASFIHSSIYSSTAGHYSVRLSGLPVVMGTMSLVVFLLSPHTLAALFLCQFSIPLLDQVGEVSACPAVVKVQSFGRVQRIIRTNKKVQVGWSGLEVWPYYSSPAGDCGHLTWNLMTPVNHL